MRRNADDFPRAQNAAGFAHGQIVLAQVNAIGVGRGGNVGAVVDDHQTHSPAVLAGNLGGLAQRSGKLQQLTIAEILFTQLNHADAGGDELLDCLGCRLAVDQHAEVGVAKLRAAGAGEGFFDCVPTVAEGLEAHPGFGRDRFAELFQAAEGLFHPFAACYADIPGIGPRGFGGRGNRRADIMPGISHGVTVVAGQGGECHGQFVPQFFHQPREMAIVEHKPGEILDDAQTLQRTVRRGVENSQYVVFTIQLYLAQPLAAGVREIGLRNKFRD